MCKARGLVTAATVPDHVKALALGGTDDDDNIQCLCGSCHDEKTRAEFGQRDTVGARGVARDGRPTSADHPWNRMRRDPPPGRKV